MKYTIIPLLIVTLALNGCMDKYYSEDDFASVRKIDSHIHINSDKGHFEEIARTDNFVLVTLNVDHGDTLNLADQLRFATLSARRNRGMVFYGPTFYFDTAGWGTNSWSQKIISYLDNSLTEGAVTVKIWKNIGMTVRDRSGKFIMVDNPGLENVFEFIKSKNLPVTGHIGEPRNCWLPLSEMTVRSDTSYFAANPQYHMFLHPEFPSYSDQIKARDNLLKAHPDLKFIGCHLASIEWNVDTLARKLDEFPNMVVDMSARICHLQYQSATDRKRVRDFCIRYQDRLLYGTDVGYSDRQDPDVFKKEMHETWLDDWKYFATDVSMRSDKFRGTFKGLHLPKTVIDKIYRHNAVKWYNLDLQ